MGIRRTLLGSAVAIAGMAGVAGYAMAAEVTVVCGSVGQGAKLCKGAATEWAKETGNTVKFLLHLHLPPSSWPFISRSLALVLLILMFSRLTLSGQVSSEATLLI